MMNQRGNEGASESFLPFFFYFYSLPVLVSDDELVSSEFVNVFCGALVLGKAGDGETVLMESTPC